MDLINAIISSIYDVTRLSKDSIIGKGPYGKVYKYYDKNLKDDVAIMKFMKKKGRPVSLYFREVINQIICAHPAVVPVIGWNIFDEASQPCLLIVMKYFEKGTLEKRLNPNIEACLKLDPTSKTIIMYGIARALQHMHSLGMVHSDLRPRNIFLDEKNYPYVTDLGLFKAKDDNMSIYKGIDLFEAPDVYSYGCVLCELIEEHSLSFPTNITSLPELLQYFRKGVLPVLKAANGSQKEFLEKLWDNDPSKSLTFDQIVKELESENYWFHKTRRKEFLAYKNYLDKEEKIIEAKLHSDRESSDTNPYIKNTQSIDPPFVHSIIMKAQNGDKNAQEVAAIFYYLGIHVIKSPLLAAYYAKQSGNQYLQILARNGDGQTDDCEAGEIYEASGRITEASKCYSNAIEKSLNFRALWRLGCIILNNDINSDFDKAIHFITIASDNGDPNASYDLGKMYITGKYLTIDYKQAVLYLKRAYKSGHPDAPMMLGYGYYKMGKIKKSKHYYRISYKKYRNEEARNALKQLESL